MDVTYLAADIAVIAAAFFLGLFAGGNRKAYSSLTFCGIGYLTVVALFGSGGNFDFYMLVPALFSVVIAAAVMLMLLNGSKSIVFFAWVLAVIFSAWMVFETVFFGGITDYYGNAAIGAVMTVFASLLLCAVVGFTVAATVIRKKRRAVGFFDKAPAADGSDGGGYVAYRVEHKGCTVCAIVLGALSYAAALLGLRAVFAEINIADMATEVMIIAFVIMALSGVASWLLMRYVYREGYEGNAVTTAMYVWTWIPAVIVIAVIVVAMLIMCAFTDEQLSVKFNKKCFKVVDENGEVRTIEKLTADMYEKCKDDRGDWWVTADGGRSFRKCGAYVLEDEDGKKTNVRDPYDTDSGRPLTVVDDKGEIYDVDNFGEATKRE